MKKLALIVIGLILAGWLAATCFYVVDTTEYAVVTLFEQHVRTDMEPGLKTKLPWPIHVVRKVDNRMSKLITPTDEDNMETVTEEGVSILYSVYALWRVSEDAEAPMKFIQSVTTRGGAENRLESIINSRVQSAIGEHQFAELISDEPGVMKQDEIMVQVLDECREVALRDYGVELVDMRFRRLNFHDENLFDVFESIKAERERIAQEIRARGQKEAREIVAEADRLKEETLAEAQRQAAALQGRGRAEATQIWNDAVARHPRFAEVWLEYQTLDEILGENTTLIGTGDLDLMQSFWNPPYKPTVEIEP